MTSIDKLARTAQISGERLTITVTGNLTIVRWGRGPGRRAVQVVDLDTPNLDDMLDALWERVKP
jgi:hypothetical protein